MSTSRAKTRPSTWAVTPDARPPTAVPASGEAYVPEAETTDRSPRAVYATPVSSLAGAPASASAAGDPGFVRGVQLHDQAVNGDQEATRKAYDLLKAAHLAHPGDPVAQAYFGSVTALRGRDAIGQDDRFSLGLRGVKILDQAVAAALDNVTVRTLRGYVCFRLPELYFHRTSTAVEDFRHLVNLYEKKRNLFSEGFYWQILYDLGKAHQILGQKAEAAAVWTKLLSVTPDPKYRELVKAEGVMDGPFEPPATPGGRLKWPQSVMKPRPKADGLDLREGIRLHDSALRGDAAAAQQAHEFLDQICRSRPGDVLAEAYRASALSLVGKHSSDTGLLFENAIKAMITLDQLVARQPDHLELRLLRASHSSRLPEPFFRRSATAIADFEYLLATADKRPEALPAATVQRILYDLGDCYDRLGMAAEARAAWSKLLSRESADPALRRLAQEKLSGSSVGAWVKAASRYGRTELVDELLRLLRSGAEGNRNAARKAYQLASQAYEASPEDALLQACYGSAVALMGKYSANPSEIFAKAVEGLLLLKKAVGRDAAEPRIRLLRGYLCHALPKNFFHLPPLDVKDFQFVKTAYERGERTIPKEAYEQVLYDLGCALKRSGDLERARKVWQKLLSHTSDPRFPSLVAAEEVN
jgi:tetratricopeptide (TPR) repeat protein